MSYNAKQQLDFITQQIKELFGLYRDSVSDLGISENEFWIWYSLVLFDEEYSQQDICNMWSLSKQTVNTIISNMVKKNYVTLEVVPGSRNRKIIRLTDEGRAHGESIALPIAQAEQRAFNRLPSEDRIACTAVLAKYTAILKEELVITKEQDQA